MTSLTPPTLAVDTHKHGLLFVFAAGVLWSTVGLGIRMIEDAVVWQILFYRSISMSLFLYVVIRLRSGESPFLQIRRIGLPAVVAGLSLVAAYSGGIYAIQNTSVANAMLLFATAPFMAAVLVDWLGQKSPIWDSHCTQNVRFRRMRTGISFTVSLADRLRLQAIVAAPRSLQKHVWRARIILLSDDGLGTMAIKAATGKSKTCIWRWQERFMTESVDGLLRDKTRPPGVAPVPADRVAEIVRLTQAPPPHEATHWTLRAMAKTAGVAASTVQGIWKSHGLSPHRWRQFKLSNDPAFLEKLTDIVGLYVAPPAHAVVLSVDEKSQIQALDRTQPGLPMKKGRGATMTHDYKRNGTTTLFAALNVLDGTIIGQNMQRHRHQEFIRFLNRIERDIPADKAIHAIVDNYAAHKHEKVRAWLTRHPRWTLHFTPTSSSWLNAVEGFFAKLTRRRLKRGVFRSLIDLQAAINRFIAEYNDNDAKPFKWTADPDKIIAARNRGVQTLESIQ